MQKSLWKPLPVQSYTLLPFYAFVRKTCLVLFGRSVGNKVCWLTIAFWTLCQSGDPFPRSPNSWWEAQWQDFSAPGLGESSAPALPCPNLSSQLTWTDRRLFSREWHPGSSRIIRIPSQSVHTWLNLWPASASTGTLRSSFNPPWTGSFLWWHFLITGKNFIQSSNPQFLLILHCRSYLLHKHPQGSFFLSLKLH